MTRRQKFNCRISGYERAQLLHYAGHLESWQPRKRTRTALLKKGLITSDNRVTDLGLAVINYYYIQYAADGVTRIPITQHE